MKAARGNRFIHFAGRLTAAVLSLLFASQTGLAACPDIVVNSTLPAAASSTTAGAPNAFSGSCGGGVAPEKSFTYTAPLSGLYLIETTAASYDTLLYVRDASCAGAELACNDDISFPGNLKSRVSVNLTAGQTVIIFVDGAGSASGTFTLGITGPCRTPVVLGNATSVSTSGTTSGGSASAGSCQSLSNNSPEKTFAYTAPVAGSYTIDTEGSSFDTVLYVLDGTTCTAAELPSGCNDDINGAQDRQSRVTVTLSDGQSIYIVVDGYNGASGNFNLHVNGPPCPSPIDLGRTFPVSAAGALVGGGVLQNTTCGPGAAGAGDEDTYLFAAAVGGDYTIDTNGSIVDTVLYVHDGNTCSGAELACDDNSGISPGQSKLTVHLDPEQQIYIVVDSVSALPNASYELHISGPPCPPSSPLSGLPVSVSGSTSGASVLANERINGAPHCGTNANGLGPEKVYSYVPPITGNYTFDTIGSSFDTVLYLRGDLKIGLSCLEDEIACDDDGGGSLTSQLTVPLAAGQPVLVVVDGFDAASLGNFNLHISGPSCPDASSINLGSQLPVNVSGDLSLAPDDLYGSGCQTVPVIGGRDVQYLYTAPFSGTYTMDTFGSDPPDTILYVRDASCLGTQLACNDNANAGTKDSELTLPLAGGQTVLIVVDAETTLLPQGGTYNLNINGVPAPTSTPTLTPTSTPTSTPTQGTPTHSPTRSPTSTPTHTGAPTPSASPTPSPTSGSVPAIDLGKAVGRPGGVACLPGTLTSNGAQLVTTSNSAGFDSASFGFESCTINPAIGPGTPANKTLNAGSGGGGIELVSIGGGNGVVPDGQLFVCTMSIGVGVAPGSYDIDNVTGATDMNGPIASSGANGQLLVTLCSGDCDGNGMVTIGEVVKCVNLFLGLPLCNAANPVLSCPPADSNVNGTVSIGEVTQCIGKFLNGC